MAIMSRTSGVTLGVTLLLSVLRHCSTFPRHDPRVRCTNAGVEAGRAGGLCGQVDRLLTSNASARLESRKEGKVQAAVEPAEGFLREARC